jgi:uncharacterized protein related to proFAR isomerase
MQEDLKYQALVSAATREEAVEIVSEAMSPEKQVLCVEAEDVSAEEGPNSWRVTLWFTGGRRGNTME